MANMIFLLFICFWLLIIVVLKSHTPTHYHPHTSSLTRLRGSFSFFVCTYTNTFGQTCLFYFSLCQPLKIFKGLSCHPMRVCNSVSRDKLYITYASYTCRCRVKTGACAFLREPLLMSKMTEMLPHHLFIKYFSTCGKSTCGKLKSYVIPFCDFTISTLYT